MGTMRLEELSFAGKVFIFLLFACLIGGGYYGYITYQFNDNVKDGNTYLSNGDYDRAITSYNTALKKKSFGSAQAEISSLINNAKTLKEAEKTKLAQEIVAIIGNKYAGIEGSNTIALRKGYYSAVEIDVVQNKIDRLKELSYEVKELNLFQNTLNNQKAQAKNKKR